MRYDGSEAHQGVAHRWVWENISRPALWDTLALVGFLGGAKWVGWW